MLTSIIITTVFIATFSCNLRVSSFPLLEECEMLDLSHDFSDDTIVWGTGDPFRLEPYFKGYTAMKYFFESYKISGAEHAGTHLDAPAHFSEGGMSTSEIPLKNLIGEVCVIDVSEKVEQNNDYQMTVDDVKKWENDNGQLTSNCVLIMRTGLSPDTAQWLVDTNRLKGFGIDTPSQDAAVTTDFKTHRILLPHNITGMENLMNLDELPNRGATVVAMPMKIKGGSGGPLRVFAFGWNGPDDPCKR